MSDEGWVRLADLPAGTAFEFKDGGTRWFFTGYAALFEDGLRYDCYSVGHDEHEHFRGTSLVRPLTAMPVHPSLRGSEMWGLVRRWAAEPGEVTAGVLLDALADHAGRDPDVAAAVREQAAKVAEEYATEARREHIEASNPRRAFDRGRVTAALNLRDRIRAMGRPAATAAACGRCGGRRGEMTCPACGGNEVRGPVCETCQGRRGEYSYPDEEGDPGNQLMNTAHWHDCPDCGGTGHTNGG